MSPEDRDRLLRLERRLERERRARLEAERLLEEKSLALYEANQGLMRAAGELEELVEARTRELHEALIQAEAASEARRHFLAVVSHEIRTPIVGILGALELLDASMDEGQERDLVRVATGSAEHLLSLVNDILDIARIDAGKIELESAVFAPSELVSGVVKLMGPAVAEQGLEIGADIGPAMPTHLRGDVGRLRQVLLNFLGNALKFTEHGRINLRLTAEPLPEGGLVALRCGVTDTGPGISSADQARLFLEFSQLKRSTSQQRSGLGLGLAISKRLIEAMGGQIGVESEAGKGSTFWFQVPLPLAEEAKPRMDEAPAALPEVTGGRILLAEDTRTNRLIITAQLEWAGFRVDGVEDGRAAVAAAAAGTYDLVLMDMMMPHLDGLAATRLIRELPGRAGRVPIVALTANAATEEHGLCLAAGMDEVLVKPLPRDALISTAERWCRRGEELSRGGGTYKSSKGELV